MAATRKRSSAKPATRRGKKGSRIKWGWIATLVFVMALAFAAWHYRSGIAYYFSFKSRYANQQKEGTLSAVHTIQVLSKHEGKSIGFDVSEYQGKITWDAIGKAEGKYPLDFVFIRSTAGSDKTDKKFDDNWTGAKKAGFMRGAYHYYRPNENSLQQAGNFILNTPLRKGDLPPILDIEQMPENQSMDRLKLGLHKWLDAVEKHYGVQPIIYTGEKYYDSFLAEEFSEYTFWIANYNFFVEEIESGWMFWQFTESAEVPGIPGKVDLNVFNGPKERLEYFGME
ncbi:GH25 family lysozyme [Flavobacterium silvaticum]|uniref:Glycoside hydrolase family 25 protein n=1 Tax=Flavobacterium silvaticum TaxID=1852020 RepID=A0A972G2U5_9FLAO|nr:GH25 family lysozyme [Flavobacterium silvaticum]NMH29466.1 glycoside hydrolase family 25 protein [Flavobacterium silvaticum]